LNEGLLPCKDKQCATSCAAQGYEEGKWAYYTSSGGYDTCSCEGVKFTSTPSTIPTITTLTTSIPEVEVNIDPELFPDEEVEEETEELEAPDPELFPEENDEEIISIEIDPNYFPDGDEGLDEALSSGVVEEFDSEDFTVTGDIVSFPSDVWNKGWDAFKEIGIEADPIFWGEDGFWTWKTYHGDPESDEYMEIKWFGGDQQYGWNQGFKSQFYLLDASWDESILGIDGITIGIGTAIDWKDKLKLDLGLPGGVSLSVVPSDIINLIKKPIDFVRNPQKYMFK
jgi:hypothetical protein